MQDEAPGDCKQSCVEIAKTRLEECVEDLAAADPGRPRCEQESRVIGAICLKDKCGDSSEVDALDAEDQ